jgi:hypothetical protein
MDVDVSIYDKGVVVVNVVEQLIARQDLAAIDQQAAQNPKFRQSYSDELFSPAQ